MMQSIEYLDVLTKPSTLVEQGEENSLRCLACAHHCLLKPGRRGICGVRFNREGTLMVPHGYVAGLQIDPIEKKPFNHFLPGGEVLTFGMLGCNFHCAFCQNWFSSQRCATLVQRRPCTRFARSRLKRWCRPLLSMGRRPSLPLIMNR
jgi:pyruvate formate lyase activating enzyme